MLDSQMQNSPVKILHPWNTRAWMAPQNRQELTPTKVAQ